MAIAPLRAPSIRCAWKQETRLRRTRIVDCVDDIKGRNGASLMSESAANASSVRFWTNVPCPRKAVFAGNCGRFAIIQIKS